MTKAIISGIPTDRVYFEPNQKSNIPPRDEEARRDTEKHYHRPVSKPVVERQTLKKETRKTSLFH